MVSTTSSVAPPVRFALRLLALFLLAASGAAAAGDPDADAAGAFDAEANMLGAGLVRGLAAAWDACGTAEGSGGGEGGGGGGGEGGEGGEGAPSGSVACQGLRLVRKALAHWSGGRHAVELSNGVELVPVSEGVGGGGRASRKLDPAAATAKEDRSLWGRVRAFLQSHELRIRLPQLLPHGDSWASYLGALHQQHVAGGAGMAAARKKDGGKGGGMALAMMGMMGGMMMMMGVAGTGALAMKAMGVASMALVMAIAAALKKLASKDDGGHHVSVVPVHAGGDYGHGHHRRRRDASDPHGDAAHRLAYAAYNSGH